MGWKSKGSYNSAKASIEVSIPTIRKFRHLPKAVDFKNKLYNVTRHSIFHDKGLYRSNGKKWIKV